MSDGLRALHALPIAVADLCVGGLLLHHVSLAVGALLVAFGVLVILTVAYRTVRRRDGGGTGTRQLA